MKNPNDAIIRILSTAAVISSASFAKAQPVKQTEILALAAGKPVVFVENFAKLGNTKLLAEKLLAGEDVAMELEFNKVTISKEEAAALIAVRPLLARLKALKPTGVYEWLPQSEIDEAKKSLSFSYSQVRQATDRSNSMSKSQAERLWKAVAPFYMGGEKPAAMRFSLRYSNRNVTFNDNDSIQVGCQLISRAQVEAAAQYFKFAAPEA